MNKKTKALKDFDSKDVLKLSRGKDDSDSDSDSDSDDAECKNNTSSDSDDSKKPNAENRDDIKDIDIEKAVEKPKRKPKQNSKSVMDEIFNKPHGMFLFVGKSCQGKSYLVRYLLTYALSHKLFKFGLCFQGSKSMNDDYSSFLPSKAIIDGYDEEKLKQWVNRLSAQKEKLKKDGKEDQMPASFIVFDDLLGKLQKSQWIDNFFSLYRHLNITIFISVQFLKTSASSTLVREQTTRGFFFSPQGANQIKAIHEYFGSVELEDYKSFKRIYKQATEEPYQSLFFCADQKNTKDIFRAFRAPADNQKIKFDF